jgi:RND family efflux transporter MFP subunit
MKHARRCVLAAGISAGLAALTGCEQGAPASAAAAPPAEVSVSLPVTGTITDALEFTGTTAALESVDVRARVTGFLDAIHFQPRAKVKKDELLFTIDKRQFKTALDHALANLEARKFELEKAEWDFQKAEELAGGGAVSMDERMTARTRRDQATAEVARAQAAADEARLELDFCSVTAPIQGRIGRNLIDVGNIVTADATMLATIVNDDDIYAYFSCAERDVLTLRERRRQELAAAGRPVSQPSPEHMPVYLGLMTERGFPHRGEIDYVSPSLDPNTGTIQVRARFPNPNGILLPGLFVRIEVPIGEPYEALTVTERALGSDQGQRYLLVVNAQNVVEYRPVQVGTLQDGLRVIEKGISPADRIVTLGLQRVRPGLTVKPVEAPMPTGPAEAVRQPATATATRPSSP